MCPAVATLGLLLKAITFHLSVRVLTSVFLPLPPSGCCQGPGDSKIPGFWLHHLYKPRACLRCHESHEWRGEASCLQRAFSLSATFFVLSVFPLCLPGAAWPRSPAVSTHRSMTAFCSRGWRAAADRAGLPGRRRLVLHEAEKPPVDG